MRNKEKKKIASQRMNLKMKEHRIRQINKMNTSILKWLSFSMLLINLFALKIGLGLGKVSSDSEQFLSKALPECRACKTFSGNLGQVHSKALTVGKPSSVFHLRFYLD